MELNPLAAGLCDHPEAPEAAGLGSLSRRLLEQSLSRSAAGGNGRLLCGLAAASPADVASCYDASGKLLPLHRRLTLGALREVVAAAATRLRFGKRSLEASVEQRWLAVQAAARAVLGASGLPAHLPATSAGSSPSSAPAPRPPG